MHRIHSPGLDIDLSRIGTMRVGADEQPVSPRGEPREHESAEAVRCRRRVRAIGSISGGAGENLVVRKRPSVISESADHRT